MHSGAQAIFQFQYSQPGNFFVLYLNILLIVKYLFMLMDSFSSKMYVLHILSKVKLNASRIASCYSCYDVIPNLGYVC
jgi:hypothetical protein